ncbi:hypothetical protein E1956_37835 [Paraburkholderia pallida]|uniref:Uncharacterized protein n=1 Tax=Paraburkholderia pallida TaxID=2547399 RepID=A0A4P7D790_9BURK|nr:hypothetical protein E1956_37835 [Paraburkholderia pallida]
MKDSPTPVEHESLFWSLGRRIFSKGLLLACFVLAIAYAAFLLLGERFKHDGVTEDQSTYSSSGTISGSSPQQQANTMSPTAEAGPRSTTPQFVDVPGSLRAARASLAENNLSDATFAINAAIMRDADNEDAHAIQRDIAAREQRRDSALQNADRCASLHAWVCVQQQASEALAIDSSSLHAQSLMEHAITETGWTPLNPPNSPNAPKNAAEAITAVPSPPGASTEELPPPQDRNAATAAAVKGSASAGAPSPASDRSGVEAQERAILQSGWRHAVPSDSTH